MSTRGVEAQARVVGPQLLLERALADDHEAHVGPPGRDERGRFEQVGVALGRAEVGDGDDQQLVRPMPSSARTASRSAASAATASTSMPCTMVRVDARWRDGIDRRTSSDTAITPSLRPKVAALAARVAGLCDGQRLCSV